MVNLTPEDREALAERSGTVHAREARIPTCITECCREWVSPFGYRGGRCGYCGERPTFVRMLPESEWVTPRPPVRAAIPPP